MPKRSRKLGQGAEGKKNGNGKVSSGRMAVRVMLEVPEGTPAYYANFIEISHTKWDFSLIATRLPAKHSVARLTEMQSTGIFPLAAEVTINFAPTLMAGLIRALTTQKEAYEKENGVELKELEDDTDNQKQARRRGRSESAH